MTEPVPHVIPGHTRRESRRRFCLDVAVAGIAAGAAPAPAGAAPASTGTCRLRVFSKHLQWLDA